MEMTPSIVSNGSVRVEGAGELQLVRLPPMLVSRMVNGA